MVLSGLKILEKAADYIKANTATNPSPCQSVCYNDIWQGVEYGLYFSNGLNLVFDFEDVISFENDRRFGFDRLLKEGETLVTVKGDCASLVRRVVLAQSGIQARIDKRAWLDMRPNQITVDMYNLFGKDIPADKILGINRHDGDEPSLVARLLDKKNIIKGVGEADRFVFQGVPYGDRISIHQENYKIWGGLLSLAFPDGFSVPPFFSENIGISLEYVYNTYCNDLDTMRSLLPQTMIAADVMMHIADDLRGLIDHYSAINKKNHEDYVNGLPPGSLGRYIEARRGNGE